MYITIKTFYKKHEQPIWIAGMCLLILGFILNLGGQWV